MSIRPRSSKTHHRRFPSSISTVLIISALLACAALAVSARGWLVPHRSGYPGAATTPARASSSSRPSTQQETPLQAELITVTPRGFEPTEITRTPGRFILMVDNHSGLSQVTFRLDQENGNRLYEKELPQEQTEWSEVVDLQPGTYLLTESEHADWLSRITITAE